MRLKASAAGAEAVMFETTERYGTAFDAETGTMLRVGSTSEYETKTLHIVLVDGQRKETAFLIMPEPSSASVAQGEICHVQLGLVEPNRLAKWRNGTREENTAFVRYILSGLAVINRKWPLWQPKARFYTNREAFKGRDLKALFVYDVPDEDEIFQLADTLAL